MRRPRVSLPQRLELLATARWSWSTYRHLGREGRLPPPLLRVVGASPPARGELAHDGGGRQVDRERDPVLGVPQPGRVHRLEEEEVEASMLATATGST